MYAEIGTFLEKQDRIYHADQARVRNAFEIAANHGYINGIIFTAPPALGAARLQSNLLAAQAFSRENNVPLYDENAIEKPDRAYVRKMLETIHFNGVTKSVSDLKRPVYVSADSADPNSLFRSQLMGKLFNANSIIRIVPKGREGAYDLESYESPSQWLAAQYNQWLIPAKEEARDLVFAAAQSNLPRWRFFKEHPLKTLQLNREIAAVFDMLDFESLKGGKFIEKKGKKCQPYENFSPAAAYRRVGEHLAAKTDSERDCLKVVWSQIGKTGSFLGNFKGPTATLIKAYGYHFGA